MLFILVFRVSTTSVIILCCVLCWISIQHDKECYQILCFFVVYIAPFEHLCAAFHVLLKGRNLLYRFEFTNKLPTWRKKYTTNTL